MDLKQIRLMNKKTQQEVANALNITQFTYSNYENRKTDPSIETLKKIANYFNVSLDYLCDNEQNNSLTKQQTELLEFAKQIDNDLDMGRLIGYAKSLAEKQKTTEEKIFDVLNEFNKKNN